MYHWQLIINQRSGLLLRFIHSTNLLRVGADKVHMSTLVQIGIEPHHFELSIQQRQAAQTANLVIFNEAGLEEWMSESMQATELM